MHGEVNVGEYSGPKSLVSFAYIIMNDKVWQFHSRSINFWVGHKVIESNHMTRQRKYNVVPPFHKTVLQVFQLTAQVL